jgi:hypothetical protein
MKDSSFMYGKEKDCEEASLKGIGVSNITCQARRLIETGLTCMGIN